jgi:hypothetical protein
MVPGRFKKTEGRPKRLEGRKRGIRDGIKGNRDPILSACESLRPSDLPLRVEEGLRVGEQCILWGEGEKGCVAVNQKAESFLPCCPELFLFILHVVSTQQKEKESYFGLHLLDSGFRELLDLGSIHF